MEFTFKTSINALSKDIYEAWLSSEGHTKMTGGKANTSKEVGFEYTAWDGYITGRNLTLEENKRIVQSWRSSDFEETEEDSQIEVLLEQNNGITELTLNHTNVPKNGDQYKKGWEEHYFQPMKAFFEKG